MASRLNQRVDHSLRSPRYIQVYSAIRNWIYQGTFNPGQRLPTEVELCQLFAVSRITTREDLRLSTGARVPRATS